MAQTLPMVVTQMQPTAFSQWMRRHLKDAYSGLIVHDIDYLLYFPATRRLYLLEEKRRRGARVGPAQAVAYAALDDLLHLVNGTSRRFPHYAGSLLFYYDDATRLIRVYPHQQRAMPPTTFLKRLGAGAFPISSAWFRTIIERTRDRLWDCRGAPPYRKTEPERSALRFAPLFKSLKPHYIVAQVDWLLINYCTGLIVALGERPLKPPEKNLVLLWDRMLKQASALNRQKRCAVNPASGSVYRYLGYYELLYTPQGPYSITDCKLNQRPVTTKQLTTLLNLEDLTAWKALLTGQTTRE
ncbi:hypothetical protein D6833_03935 [Candidatus Parcubacteria bacterium]|nr:MAG: hypothetical protein D6833_03935 [Candidatus Parcubacteria bacterium]